MSIIGTQDSLSDEQLSSAVQKEMEQWFGSSQVADWQLLKIYRIPFAQPNQASLSLYTCRYDLEMTAVYSVLS